MMLTNSYKPFSPYVRIGTGRMAFHQHPTNDDDIVKKACQSWLYDTPPSKSLHTYIFIKTKRENDIANLLLPSSDEVVSWCRACQLLNIGRSCIATYTKNPKTMPDHTYSAAKYTTSNIVQRIPSGSSGAGGGTMHFKRQTPTQYRQGEIPLILSVSTAFVKRFVARNKAA
jgi:hypothetical protein